MEVAGLYLDDRVVNIQHLATELDETLPTGKSQDLLDYLPCGKSATILRSLEKQYLKMSAADQKRLSEPLRYNQLRVPIPNPSKIILLAGNYAAHVVEGGDQAPERQKTFPYFFLKPPTTTLNHPGNPIRIPLVSPNHIDWEVELGVIIGRRCRQVSEENALRFVAGYTVCNDISDRRFQINPDRKTRDKDRFFDWLHGKWHDTFLPCGPCVLSAASLKDPQTLNITLRVNGETMQDSSTAHMIFPVSAIVSILSKFVTLEPGDIISTGTPSGVGNARTPPIYLQPRDVIEAEIEGIGILENPVADER